MASPLLRKAVLASAKRTLRALAAGADVNALGQRLLTPLHKAAMHGYLETMTALLAAGANPCAQNDALHTPMGLACANARPEAVRVLLAHGVDEARLDSAHKMWAKHPMHAAVDGRSARCIELLACMDFKVDPIQMYGLNANLMTPLHRACELGSLDCVMALYEAGADIEVRDSLKRTPREVGKDAGAMDVVYFFDRLNARQQAEVCTVDSSPLDLTPGL